MITNLNDVNRTFYAHECLSMPLIQKCIFYSSANIMNKYDNTTCLLDAVLSSDYADKFTHIVCIRNYNEAYEEFRQLHSDMKNIVYVSYNTKEYIKAVMTSEYVISDGKLPSYYIKRDGQTHCNMISYFDFDFRLSLTDNKADTYTQVGRNLCQSSYLICNNEKMYDNLNNVLMLGCYFNGKIIKSAEPSCEQIKSIDTTAEMISQHEIDLAQRYSDNTDIISADNNTNACKDILSAVFENDGDMIAFENKGKDKEKILFIANLNERTPLITNLCNVIDRIDFAKYSVTMLAYDTNKTAVCRTINPNARVLIRKGYLFASEQERTDWDESHDKFKKDIAVPDDYFCATNKKMWSTEAVRMLGTDCFDKVVLFNEFDVFWLAFCNGITSKSKMVIAQSDDYIKTHCANYHNVFYTIENMFDKVILADTSDCGFDEKMVMPLPVICSAKWGRQLAQKPEFIRLFDGKANYDCINGFTTSIAGCTLIPAFDSNKTNYFTVADNLDDAKKIADLFAQHTKNRTDKVMYLQILQPCDPSSICAENIITINDKRVSLLLLSYCDCYIDAYARKDELCEIAKLMGDTVTTASKKPCVAQLTKSYSVYLAGTESDSLYTEYTSSAERKPLSVSSASFDITEDNSGYLKSYDKATQKYIDSFLAI